MSSPSEKPVIGSAWAEIEYHIRIPDQEGLHFTPPDHRALRNQGHTEEDHWAFFNPLKEDHQQLDLWSQLNQEKNWAAFSSPEQHSTVSELWVDRQPDSWPLVTQENRQPDRWSDRHPDSWDNRQPAMWDEMKSTIPGYAMPWRQFRWYLLGSCIIWGFIFYGSFQFYRNTLRPFLWGPQEDDAPIKINPALLEEQRRFEGGEVKIGGPGVEHKEGVIHRARPKAKNRDKGLLAKLLPG